MINKKDQVRNHLLKMANNSTFTLSSLASDIGVSTKDVNNVTSQMVKHGVFTREVNNKIHTYTVDSNAVALYSAEHNKKPAPVVQPIPTKPVKKAKRRSACVMEIDNRIAELQVKISQLKLIRREFA